MPNLVGSEESPHLLLLWKAPKGTSSSLRHQSKSRGVGSDGVTCGQNTDIHYTLHSL